MTQPLLSNMLFYEGVDFDPIAGGVDVYAVGVGGFRDDHQLLRRIDGAVDFLRHFRQDEAVICSVDYVGRAFYVLRVLQR